MAKTHEISSRKIHVKDIFSNMWFRIPVYQRPYIWSEDEVSELVDDLLFAYDSKPEAEYFLGSFVFQSKESKDHFKENDLLDGQQRMTTLMLLFACIRDLSTDPVVKSSCQRAILSEADRIDGIPERTRIVFAIRDEVQEFIEDFVKHVGGTAKESEIRDAAQNSTHASIPNMAQAILTIRRRLASDERLDSLEGFLRFVRHRVLMIYVATENLDDAFRLFTILNDRGVPLRNSDILKSTNLGALEDASQQARYARMWEEAEGALGDDFDRFLNHLRAILLRDKARLSLLQEFETKIYNPIERDRETGKQKPALLQKGKETFELVERYLKHYETLLGGANYDHTGRTFEFDNLISVMLTGLPSTDWVPPLMRYFDRFRYDGLLPFLVKLDNKLSGDWIAQLTPTTRIENMNQIIRVVERADNAKALLADPCFDLDAEGIARALSDRVYGRRFARYVLLKLDFLLQDHSHRMSLETLSVEHVLPQNPAEDSQWTQDFSPEERETWTDRLGNLVLISTRKNTSQGRLDFEEKKERYFLRRVTTCPNSLRVLQSRQWKLADLAANQAYVLNRLADCYKIQMSSLNMTTGAPA